MVKDHKFQFEVGAVISKDNDVVAYVDGTKTHIDFPSEFILQLHQALPGFVGKLAHTHPEGMKELSARDRQTLKTWAYTIYPFPMRMSTITRMGGVYQETTYLGLLEPKEIWRARGGERGFTIIEEYSYQFIDPRPAWMQTVLEKSYHFKT